MLRRGSILHARGKGCALGSSDRFLAKLSLNDSNAKPKRNNRDLKNATTSLSEAEDFLTEARISGKLTLEDEFIYEALLKKEKNNGGRNIN